MRQANGAGRRMPTRATFPKLLNPKTLHLLHLLNLSVTYGKADMLNLFSDRTAQTFRPLRQVLFLLNLLLFCSVWLNLPAQAQKEPSHPPPPPPDAATPQATPSPTPKSNVKGRVMYADTQRPLRRVAVSLVPVVSGVGGEGWSATDEQGYFVFKNVAAGSYVVAVNAPGVVTPSAFFKWEPDAPSQEPDWTEARKVFETITVNGDDNVETNVQARRGGVVSGKIAYDDGDAAINVQLSLSRKMSDGTLRPIFGGYGSTALARLRTDDRGYYRIAGLPPGEYVISAAEANTDPNQPSGDGDAVVTDALVRTYYGDTSDPKQARSFTLDFSSEARDIDIRLVDTTWHTISGNALAARDGRPLKEISVQLIPKEKSYSPYGAAQRYTQTDADGNWNFRGIPDGVYYVVAEAPYEAVPNPSGEEPRYERNLLRKRLEITLTGGDQTGVALRLEDGGSLSGTIVWEGKRPKSEDSYSVCLRADPLKDAEKLWQSGEFSTCADENRKIVLAGLPTGALRVLSASLPEGYYIKAMTAKGLDLLKQPLTLAASENVRDWQIIIAAGAGRLIVKAQDAAGKPLANAPVLLIPADELRRGDVNSYQRGLTDATGAWTVENCTPGEYLIFLPTLEEVPRFTQPGYVETQIAQAQRVTLRVNETKTAEVKAKQ